MALGIGLGLMAERLELNVGSIYFLSRWFNLHPRSFKTSSEMFQKEILQKKFKAVEAIDDGF